MSRERENEFLQIEMRPGKFTTSTGITEFDCRACVQIEGVRFEHRWHMTQNDIESRLESLMLRAADFIKAEILKREEELSDAWWKGLSGHQKAELALLYEEAGKTWRKQNGF